MPRASREPAEKRHAEEAMQALRAPVKRSSGWRELGGFNRGLIRRLTLPTSPQPLWTPSLPVGRWVDLDGRAVFVRTLGGPAGAIPVLLLHGWSWSMDLNFAGLFAPLSAHHPIVALDQRGHGHSPRSTTEFEIADLADDAVAVMDALGIPRVIVCGYSLGGVVALQLGLRHPDRVAGLSVHACALNYRQTLRDRLVWPLLRASAPWGNQSGPTSVVARIYATYRHEPSFEQRWPWLRAELARTSHAAIVEAGAAVRRHDLRGRVESLRELPTSMVLTSRDTVCLPWIQHQLADQIGAHIVTLDDDHLAPITEPERYARAAIDAISVIAGAV